MSTTIHHLQTLVGLGARPIASPANQAAADYLMIREQMVRQGEPNTVLSRPDIQEVTVRGQPGAWMPTGGGKNLLAWEENGITYMIISNKVPKDEVLKIAESLGK